MPAHAHSGLLKRSRSDGLVESSVTASAAPATVLLAPNSSLPGTTRSTILPTVHHTLAGCTMGQEFLYQSLSFHFYQVSLHLFCLLCPYCSAFSQTLQGTLYMYLNVFTSCVPANCPALSCTCSNHPACVGNQNFHLSVYYPVPTTFNFSSSLCRQY